MPSLPPAIHLSYTVEGEGPLVVGLHDLGRTGEDMMRALGTLRDDHRLLVPDLRGHGSSPCPAGPWSIDDFASDVARLVAAEGGGAIVVGVGLGAATALALALGHPGMAGALVLSGTGPRGEDQEGRDRWQMVARALRERRGQEGLALAAEAMGTRPDWRGALGQVEVPVTILAGSEDRATPVKLQRELAMWIRGSRFVTVPGAGHDMAADRPQELVAAVTRLSGRDRVSLAA